MVYKKLRFGMFLDKMIENNHYGTKRIVFSLVGWLVGWIDKTRLYLTGTCIY